MNYRATDITYGIVAIIKKTRNYRNNQSAVNAYYQALRKLRELRKADTISETASVIGSSKGSFTLDHIWYNIKNLWKGKKKVETEKTEEPKEQFYTLSPPSSTEDPFQEVSLEAAFDKLDPKEGLYKFRKKRVTSKDLASYLPKHLRELLKNREQVLKDKRTFQVGYTEKTSEIL